MVCDTTNILFLAMIGIHEALVQPRKSIVRTAINEDTYQRYVDRKPLSKHRLLLCSWLL